jgi:DNA-binding Lrp family transcriptional regulator
VADRWYTKSEIAAELKVSPRTIERRIKPDLKVGGINRYTIDSAEAQLRGVPDEGAVVIQFPTRQRTAA